MVQTGQGCHKNQGQVELRLTSECLLKVILNKKGKNEGTLMFHFPTFPTSKWLQIGLFVPSVSR